MKTYLEKHNGNFSAAIREVIELAEEGSRFRGGDYSGNGCVLVDCPTLEWFLKRTEGMLFDEDSLNEIIEPSSAKSLSKLEEFINAKSNGLGWQAQVAINYDNDINPSSAVVSIKGGDYRIIDFLARIIVLFLAKNKCLGIQTIYRGTRSMKIGLKRKNNLEAAYEDLLHHIGYMESIAEELSKKPDFWRAIAKKHRDSDYKMVTVHLNHYEDLLARRTPLGEIGIESMAKRPIEDIPLSEFLPLMKEVYETARVVDRIDIEGDTIKVFHSYRNPKAVETLKKIFLRLLEANGHTYNAKSTRNLIILRHMPEIGIKISELIGNLKKSGSNFDKELIAFLTFLSGLKDAPDVGESIRALGYRMSKQILREYEKEHKIKVWDLKTFQEAFSTLDSKTGRLSEWRLVNNNSICYIVKKCNLVQIGGSFNIDICRFSRGIFKGALDYAFKNDAEVKVMKLLSHGDDRCEVCIRLHTSIP